MRKVIGIAVVLGGLFVGAQALDAAAPVSAPAAATSVAEASPAPGAVEAVQPPARATVSAEPTGSLTVLAGRHERG